MNLLKKRGKSHEVNKTVKIVTNMLTFKLQRFCTTSAESSRHGVPGCHSDKKFHMSWWFFAKLGSLKKNIQKIK